MSERSPEIQEALSQRIGALEMELKEIRARNARVEEDKAWETSLFRISFLVVLTYIVTSIVFWIISVPYPFRNALIPTTGYLLSTLSLPLLKTWWLSKR